MKKFIYIITFSFLILSSCNESDELIIEENGNEKTLLVYMPWSSNLTSYFYQNIKDLESCIAEMQGLSNERVLVFISGTPTEASLFEIIYKNGKCQRDELKEYSNPSFTTADGISDILEDVQFFAPAKKYAMIIGCHGMGWLPVNTSRSMQPTEKYHWEYTHMPLTRYFGGTSAEYQTDISTLSSAIASCGMKMEYILFDDCYMSSIEVAYELKDVADYLIASTCEVMAYGMPYATMGKHLLGQPDYKAVCDDFYDFYSHYTVMPCGTLSVTDLSRIEDMADIMRHINTSYTFDAFQRDKLQHLDGYSPTIFYDFGDYVNLMLSHNKAPESLVNEFNMQLNLLIPYKTNTETFYTASRGPLKLDRYSGITTSDPSISQRAAAKTATKWFSATH